MEITVSQAKAINWMSYCTWFDYWYKRVLYGKHISPRKTRVCQTSRYYSDIQLLALHCQHLGNLILPAPTSFVHSDIDLIQITLPILHQRWKWTAHRNTVFFLIKVTLFEKVKKSNSFYDMTWFYFSKRLRFRKKRNMHYFTEQL